MTQPIDIQASAEPQPQALALVGHGGEVGKTPPPDQIRPPVTAAQAKVEAIANLTMAAYAKTATLELTDAEIAALQAPFPDEAFQRGAGGKDNLIYIEHAFLRDRLNQVFRPGQWAIVPRNRWAEPFKTAKGVDGSRVYVEAMLIVRGAFVAEAIGEMEYYPSNGSQNYGDAVEGAKTAALRRCCKEISIGLQAWKKDWCAGWWQRNRSGRPQAASPAPEPPKPRPQAPKPAQAPPANANQPSSASPDPAKVRERAIQVATEAGHVEHLGEYLVAAGIILDNETIQDWPAQWLPQNKEQMLALLAKLADFANGLQAERPYPPHDVPEPPKVKAAPRPTPEPQAAPTVNPAWEHVAGIIEHVSVKTGTSKKGPWTCYGIKVAGNYHNTFSNRLGQLAEANQGKQVTLYYTQTDKGRTAEGITV